MVQHQPDWSSRHQVYTLQQGERRSVHSVKGNHPARLCVRPHQGFSWSIGTSIEKRKEATVICRRSESLQEWALYYLDVDWVGGCLVCRISLADAKNPPFALQNLTQKTLVWRQKNGFAQCTVPANGRVPFCFDQSLDELLILSDGVVEAKGQISSKVGAQKEFVVASLKLLCRVEMRGPTRVLFAFDSERLLPQVPEKSAAQFPPLLKLELKLQGIGLSLNSELEETMYCRVENVCLSYVRRGPHNIFELEVKHVQLDNQLRSAVNPVIFSSIPNEGPLFHAKMHSIDNNSLYHVRELGVTCQPFFFQVDMPLLLHVEQLFSRFRYSEQAGASSLEWIQPQLPSQFDLHHKFAKRLFVELLEISSLYFVVCLLKNTSSRRMQGTSNEEESSRAGAIALLNRKLNAFGMVLSDVDETPLSMNALTLSHLCAPHYLLTSHLESHYRKEAMSQALKLFNSAKLLGLKNPVGVLQRIGHVSRKDFSRCRMPRFVVPFHGIEHYNALTSQAASAVQLAGVSEPVDLLKAFRVRGSVNEVIVVTKFGVVASVDSKKTIGLIKYGDVAEVSDNGDCNISFQLRKGKKIHTHVLMFTTRNDVGLFLSALMEVAPKLSLLSSSGGKVVGELI